MSAPSPRSGQLVERRLAPVSEARPTAVGLVADQFGHALLELWRSRLVLVFTFILPLMWLLLIGLLAGNDVLDPTTGLRVMQFVTPMAAVMGIVFAAYPPVANAIALAREQQLIKRLRGTPVPIWAYLLGQAGAAILLASAALVLMLAIGVAGYGVQIQWQTVPASVVTLVVAMACFAALGLAVGALAPSAETGQAFAMASAVLLAFVSGLFNVGGNEPAWMAPIGRLFPVRNLADPLSDQFNPAIPGSGWEPGALAMLAAWGVLGLVVAIWALRREPGVAAGPVTPERGPVPATRQVSDTSSLRAAIVPRPDLLRLTVDQAIWALRAAARNPSLVFFAIAMPVGLYALICSMYPAQLVHGMPLATWFAAGIIAYGTGVVGFMNIPAGLAASRDRGALKRLRGTPVPPWVFLAGRAVAVLCLGLLIGLLTLIVGRLAFGLELQLDGLPAATAVLLLGGLALTTCGYALISVVPTARASAAMSMAILLPLAFVSEIFVVGDIPEPIPTLAGLFPLKHLVAALAATLNPAGWSLSLGDIGVVAAWLVAAALVAVRRFRWEPSAEPTAGARPGRPRRHLLRHSAA
jgi:ABC-type multidrug transport system permease subunit